MNKIAAKSAFISIFIGLSLIGCNQQKKQESTTQETQKKEVTIPHQTPSNVQPQKGTTSNEEEIGSDKNSSTISIAPPLASQDKNNEEEKKVEDILALIRSLNLPKELLGSVENHPMYNALTKTVKHERIVFQDSFLFGKYRCKKAIEDIKSKNLNSRFLENFDKLNLCGFLLSGVKTYIDDQSQLRHIQTIFPPTQGKFFELLWDNKGIIQASTYAIVNRDSTALIKTKMNMPNGHYHEYQMRYDTIGKVVSANITATNQIADQFKYEYFITNEKTAALPFSDIKLEYPMSDNRILLVKEHETTAESSNIECEITITKDDKIIFKKTRSKRCFNNF